MKHAIIPEMRDGAFILGGKPEFIYSGEFHYFRSDPEDWNDRLKRAREAGLNAVASYIPWRWHEIKEGVFDFTGKTHPRRNLLKFLELTAKQRLFFVPRVGPVSNGEMMNEGLPDWLSEKYPNLFLGSNSGKTIHHQRPPAYNHPEFMEKVRSWYRHLLPLLTKLQYPGGNIIFFQLCNEIGMINWLGKIGDYAPYSNEMYRRFLKTRYGEIKNLNAACKTSYKGFGEIKQPGNYLEERNLKTLLDWGDYYKEYYAVYFGKLHDLARELGVHTPVQANIPQFYDYDLRGRGLYSPTTTIKFGDFPRKADGVIFGGAYQMRRLDYENFHDIGITSAVVRSITPKGSPAVCAELQTGILSDKPRLYPADVGLNLRTTLMSGLNGLNCYMFSGGTNEEGIGQFGKYHEWQAPIASDGTLRSHFYSLKNFGSFINGLGKAVAGMPPAADINIGFYPDYYNTEYLSGPLADRLFDLRNEFFFDGMARMAYLSGRQVGLVDIKKDGLSGVKALSVASIMFMDAETQRKLYDYVSAGGLLLFCGETMLRDPAWNKSEVFLRLLGLKAERESSVRTVSFLGKETYLHNQDINVFKGLSRNDKVLARFGGKPCGLLRKVGKGRLCLLGFHFSDKFDYFKPAFDSVCSRLGIAKSVSSGNYDLITMLRRNADSGFLFIANYHDDITGGEVSLRFNGENIRFPVRMRNRTGVVTPVHLRLGGGATLRYATCEVTSAVRTGGKMEIHYRTDSVDSDIIAISGFPVSSAASDGAEVSFSEKKGTVVLKIRHSPGYARGRITVR
ncbi:MAG: hypothetical protein COT17_06200 [Elusimicrobia bacterium CG08_land_8_20_14_0_20_51_18]|nr:MAG: hypothetical protein COT17_06200 [Elusimicrobia bacterium CG08_land_8_20_14_0_20_51_18]